MTTEQNPAYENVGEKAMLQARDHAEAEALSARNDMKTLLELPAGRRFIWRLLDRCSLYESTFTGNSSGYYREGRRAVGLEVLQEIVDAKPSAYGDMFNESFKSSGDSNES